MNPFPPTFPGDWLSLTIRWLFMALFPVAIAQLGTMEGPVIWVVLAWIGAGLFESLLHLRGRYSRLLGSLSMVLDTLFGLVLIAVTGWESSPLWWCLLLAALQAGLARGLRSGGLALTGGLVSAVVLSLAFNRFNMGVLGVAALQATLVLLGWAVLSLPTRWARISMQAWQQARSQVVENERLEERHKVGQLSSLTAEINAALDPAQISSQGLELCLQLLGEKGLKGKSAYGAVYQHRDDDLITMASSNASAVGSIGLEANLVEALFADVLAKGEVLHIDNPSDTPVIAQLIPGGDWCEAIAAPLVAGSSMWGLLVIGHPDPKRFNQEDFDLTDAVARQMGVALYNAQLYADMVAERDRISDIQEEVRKKLARDLHDGPTQVVAAIAMRVNFARRLLSRDRDKAADELQKVEEMARRTTKEIRHMLFTLRPLILESQGLVAALNQLVDKTIETHGQPIHLEMDPGLNTSLGLERESVVFFIAEEAINNARKHAAAAHIWVRLMQEGDWFVLEVEDDGAGFNVGAVDRDYEQRGSLGMVNMRERAELVNGELHIESTEGVGTLVRLKVPTSQLDESELRLNTGLSQASELGED